MVETAESLNNHSLQLAAKGDFQEAVACLLRAITLESENHLLWFNLGVTYRDFGDLENSRSALEKAHDLAPEDNDTIETLAAVYFSGGAFDESLELCMEGLCYAPENSHLWNTMGAVYFNREEYEDAASAFEQALSLNPYYYDALYNLHDTYCELGNAAGAEECVKKMKEIKK